MKTRKLLCVILAGIIFLLPGSASTARAEAYWPAGPEVEAGIAAALTAGGLPLSAPYGAAELAAAAMADKKRAGAEITLVLPREIGRCELRRVPATELEALARLAVGN